MESMRGGGVAVLGALGLVACALVTIFMAWGPLILAALTAVLIVIGAWLGGLKVRSSPFCLNAMRQEDNRTTAPMLHGVNIGALQRGEIRLMLRNVSVLAGVAALCVATLVAYSWAGISYTAYLQVDEAHSLLFFALTYLGIIPLMVAGAWAQECLLLRAPAITIGLVQRHVHRRLRGLWTIYEFRDQRGEYFGGTSHNYDKKETDNMVFVFFMPLNPTFNAASCSLMFHRVELTIESAAAST